MIRRPPRSTPLYSSAASDVYKRQGQAMGTRSDVDIVEGGATLHVGDAGVGVHSDLTHPGEVGDDCSVRGAEAGHAVRSTPHRQVCPSVAGIVDHCDDIGRRCADGHSFRSTVDHEVVDGTCLVVSGIVGGDYGS